MKKRFSSKILLFGEYSVIRQSHALAIPYPVFEGELSFPKNATATTTDNELKEFATHLQRLEEKDQLLCEFDINAFLFDIAGGLFFDSTIPQGFGAGSSGALVAALYDRYVKNKSEELDLLKKQFAQLESHFHGSSSGFDPLVSYCGSPILIGENQKLKVVSIPEKSHGEYFFFLLNTGRARRTEPLVNLFLEKCTQEDFVISCNDELIPVTNNCIHYFLNNQTDELLESFKKLSRFQYNHLLPMIPKLYHDMWKDGLDSDDYSLKLCGAGGGGFLLGICRDLSKIPVKRYSVLFQ